MTLGYIPLKARSHGQTHYFFHQYAAGSYFGGDDPMIIRNYEVALKRVTKMILSKLEDPEAVVERCGWNEWDTVPRAQRHTI